MNKKLFSLLFVLILASLLLTACGGGQQQDAGEESGADTAEEVVPAPYAGKTNPMKGNTEAAAAGKTLYDANCATCHGDSGKGDGPAGASLTPKPANLVEALKEGGEDFVFYRISEGGQMAPYNSSMPSFKGMLSEDERWQIVTHIETFK